MLKIIRPKETSQIAVVTGSNRINGNKLKNKRRESSRHFRNKKRQYMKDKINELARSSKSKNVREIYREINGFKRG
jgi:hypothetical protein